MLERNKKYITKNNFIVIIEEVDREGAHAVVLGTMISETERKRFYTLEGKDENDEAFDIAGEYRTIHIVNK